MPQLFNVAALVAKDGCRKAILVAHGKGVGNHNHLKGHLDPCSPEKKHRELQNYFDIQCFI